MDDQLTFRIPPELGRLLARRARERGVPRSLLVREALTGYLAAAPDAASPGSRWDAVAGFVGALRLDPAAIEADQLARRIRAHNWRP